MRSVRSLTTSLVLLAVQMPAQPLVGQEVVLKEVVSSRKAVEVATTVNLSGSVKSSEGEETKRRAGVVSASSAMRYRERILDAPSEQGIEVTARRYLTATLEKQTPEGKQRIALRPAVERIVVRRANHESTVFSPDGPLTGAELDLLRAETFTPALSGLLPAKPVTVGDRWQATGEAILELTRVGPLQSGGLNCVLRELKTTDDRAIARVDLSGSLVGPSELGPTRLSVEGYYLFDVDHQLVTHVVWSGQAQVLGSDGQAIGQLEGRFELDRRPTIEDPRLTDRALGGLNLKPTPETTALVFEGSELAVRFLYPRNWELVGVDKNLIRLHEPTGGNLRVTIDSSPAPTAQKLRTKLLDWLQSQKATVQDAGSPGPFSLSGSRAAERFTVRATMPQKPTERQGEWDYVLVRQASRSAVVEASLAGERSESLRGDIEFVARRLEFLPKAER